MKKHLAAVSILPFLMMASPVAAQEDSAAGSQNYDENTIVVTAAGYEQRIAEAPASISVLTHEELETRPFTSLADAVRNVEGISITGYNPNDTDNVIRGMPGEYTLIMLDGRRQTTGLTIPAFRDGSPGSVCSWSAAQPYWS